MKKTTDRPTVRRDRMARERAAGAVRRRNEPAEIERLDRAFADQIYDRSLIEAEIGALPEEAWRELGPLIGGAAIAYVARKLRERQPPIPRAFELRNHFAKISDAAKHLENLTDGPVGSVEKMAGAVLGAGIEHYRQREGNDALTQLFRNANLLERAKRDDRRAAGLAAVKAGLRFVLSAADMAGTMVGAQIKKPGPRRKPLESDRRGGGGRRRPGAETQLVEELVSAYCTIRFTNKRAGFSIGGPMSRFVRTCAVAIGAYRAQLTVGGTQGIFADQIDKGESLTPAESEFAALRAFKDQAIRAAHKRITARAGRATPRGGKQTKGFI